MTAVLSGGATSEALADLVGYPTEKGKDGHDPAFALIVPVDVGAKPKPVRLDGPLHLHPLTVKKVILAPAVFDMLQIMRGGSIGQTPVQLVGAYEKAMGVAATMGPGGAGSCRGWIQNMRAWISANPEATCRGFLHAMDDLAARDPKQMLGDAVNKMRGILQEHEEKEFYAKWVSGENDKADELKAEAERDKIATKVADKIKEPKIPQDRVEAKK